MNSTQKFCATIIFNFYPGLPHIHMASKIVGWFSFDVKRLWKPVSYLFKKSQSTVSIIFTVSIFWLLTKWNGKACSILSCLALTPRLHVYTSRNCTSNMLWGQINIFVSFFPLSSSSLSPNVFSITLFCVAKVETEQDSLSQAAFRWKAFVVH